MYTLQETLSQHTVEDLNSRLRLIGIKAKSTRKADVIQALKDALLGKSLRELFHSLSPLEQLAIAETCYASLQIFHPEKIAAKHGECPPLSTPRNDQDRFSSWYSGTPTRLTLFLYKAKYEPGHFIPDDLAAGLKEFIAEPDPLTISTLANPPAEDGITTRLTEQEALSDVTALLRLAEQGNLRTTAKTGTPTATGRKAMLDCLSGGDFFPPEIAYLTDKKSWQQEIGAIKLVGWVRLLQTGGYLTAGGSKSSLTPAGIKALSKPRHTIIRHLWKKWLTTNKFDEFNRVDAIKGQKAKAHMTAKAPRRAEISFALMDCPTNEWIDIQTLSSYMQAEGYDFEISNRPYKLYLSEAQYGNFGYSGYGGWNILQLRYIMAVLFEYAATLGLIDIAYVHPAHALSDFRNQWGADDLEWLSRYDGLRAFRITNLGAYCFGLTDEFQESTPTTSLRLKLSTDLSIQLLSKTIQPTETLLLETWAEPIGNGIWRLDPLRARDAIERGNSSDDFLTFLQQCDEQPVPETILGFLKTSLNNGKAVRNAGEARLFNCRDAQTASMILEQKNLKGICARCGETQLVVPTEHLQKFQKHIHALGLGIV